jgi:molybdate transport system substrate-binding protein
MGTHKELSGRNINVTLFGSYSSWGLGLSLGSILAVMKSLIFSSLFLLQTWGCSAELTVSAAASLTQAFQDVALQFEKQYPETKVRLNFGASGALMQQIANGAPVDVFASADTDTMDKAVAKGAVTDVKVFTTNKLVVIAPIQSKANLLQLADLKKPEVKRIAMGTPASVPAGHYAQGSLEKAGLWIELKDKIINTTNVRQALDYVARDEVDAGFVYASDAQLMQDKVKVAFQVTTTAPIQYPIAKVMGSTQPEAANKFIAFVQSTAAQAILKKYGFGS